MSNPNIENVAILAGGDSFEYPISILSANTVLENLDNKLFKGYIVHTKKNEFTVQYQNTSLKINKKYFSFKLKNKNIKFHKIFLAIHGPPAENGLIQPYFDKLNIPYSACNHEVSKLTFNKYLCNQKLKELGFNCANSVLYSNNAVSIDYVIDNITFPCFVKPNKSGSSFGVQKIKDSHTIHTAIQHALKYDEEVIIEEEINGKEISCGIYKDNNEITPLPLTEIKSKNDFFDYNAKYNGEAEEITPAKINKNLTRKIHKTSTDIYQILKLKGICRIDFIIKNDIPYIIEINTIPGLSKESIIPQQIKAANRNLSEVITLCLTKVNI